MKRTITLLSILMLVAFAGTSKAQTPMPNGGFETWTDTVTCDSWNSNNLDLGIVTYNFVKQTTDKHSGMYAAQVQTMATLISTMGGVITLGQYTMLIGPSGGYPISGKPSAVNGFYKYNAVGGDTMIIYVALTKWNTATSTRDTLSEGVYAVAGSVAAYTAFSIPLTYTPPTDMPDSVNILGLSSGGYAPQDGSTLYLDDLAFAYGGAGIQESALANVSVFPNPANNFITVSLNNEQDNTIEIIDIIGKIVYSQKSDAAFERIDISSLNEGMYIVRVNNQSETIAFKIMISR